MMVSAPPGSIATAGTTARRVPPVAAVIIFLLLTRLLLNLPALLGANLGPLEQGQGAVAEVNGDATTLPGVWARWDSGYYLKIARQGYALEGHEVAFFPGYAVLMRVAALGQTALLMWAGYLISNLAFVAAGAVLWLAVQAEYGAPAAWGTVISLAVFPTALFYSAIYAESLFLLFGVLTYWFTTQRRYGLAALCVAGAGLTRITGALFILIPLIALWQQRSPGAWRQRAFWLTFIQTGLIVGAGLSLFAGYLWVTQGSPVAFLGAHAQYWSRTYSWPWVTIGDSALVALFGNGGNQTNWLMREISAIDVMATLLMVALTVLGLWWLPRGLAAYQAAAMLFMLVSHGPLSYGLWSMSRVVLGLFPGFIVLGRLLTRWPKARWLAWTAWGLSLAVELGFTAWFGSGRWLA